MKTRIFPTLPLAIAAFTLTLTTDNIFAQDASTAAAVAAQPAAASQGAPLLSYGVPEVLQLSQAKVGDSTIINYIHNSGNNYGLNAAQIIYLRQQGVSDAVINAMLNQRSQSAQTASAATYSAPANVVAYNSQVAAPAAQPAVTYVETVPSSSVYVIPDTQTYSYNSWLYYHSAYPYYSYYPAYSYCWPYSGVSVSFIGGRGWVGYRGGWQGNTWRGGGVHVGGGYGGGWHGGGGRHR